MINQLLDRRIVGSFLGKPRLFLVDKNRGFNTRSLTFYFLPTAIPSFLAEGTQNVNICFHIFFNFSYFYKPEIMYYETEKLIYKERENFYVCLHKSTSLLVIRGDLQFVSQTDPSHEDYI